MASVGQKFRPPMARGSWLIDLSYGLQLPVQDTDAHEGPEARRSKHNHAVPIPGSAAASRRIRQRLWRTTSKIDAVELARRKVANRPAVGRPEGILRAIGSGEWLRVNLVQRSHPQPLRSTAAGHKREF